MRSTLLAHLIGRTGMVFGRLKLARSSADKIIVLRGLAFVALASWSLGAECLAVEPPQNQPCRVNVAAADFEFGATVDEDGRGLVLRLEHLRAISPLSGWRGEPRSNPRSDQRDGREQPIGIVTFGARDEIQTFAPMSRPGSFCLARGAIACWMAAASRAAGILSWRGAVYGCPLGSTRGWRNFIPPWRRDARKAWRLFSPLN
jgi:hypothetical protein